MTTSKAAAPASPATAFDPFDAAYLSDPYPTFARVRAATPVFNAPALGMWVVTRYADVDAVLRDHELYSSAITHRPVVAPCPAAQAVLTEGDFRPLPTMVNCDPPDHARIRALNNAALSPRRVAILEPKVRADAAALIAAMRTRGRRGDLVAGLGYPLPAHTMFTLLGFPKTDTDMLKRWGNHRVMFTWGHLPDEQQIQVARQMAAYWQYCQRFARTRLAEPQDDFVSDLVRTHLADPAALSIDEIASIAYGLSFAGHETTTNMIGNTVRRLLEHRNQWEMLVSDPSLINNAVEEAIRYDTSIVTWRRITTKPSVIGGVEVPAGAKLLVLLASAGRDPAVFDEPERFDITRDNARNHLGFGKGIHFCHGAQLARMQLRIVLELLASELPSLRMVDDQTISFPDNLAFRGPVHLEVTW